MASSSSSFGAEPLSATPAAAAAEALSADMSGELLPAPLCRGTEVPASLGTATAAAIGVAGVVSEPLDDDDAAAGGGEVASSSFWRLVNCKYTSRMKTY